MSSQASPAGVSPAAEPPGVLDYLKQRGLDLGGQYGDDHAALDHLLQAYQSAKQNAQWVQYGQQAYYRQQEEAARQAQAQQPQKKWWQAPEWNPAWLDDLVRAPDGSLSVRPGADPMLVQKHRAWQEHLNKSAHQFFTDPIETLKPGLQELVRAEAQQLIQQQLQGYGATSYAQDFVRQNADWLLTHDAAGNVMRDPATGTPALSDAGRLFARNVDILHRSGIQDVQQQQQLASALVELELLRQKQGQQPAPPAQPQLPTGEAQKRAFLQAAAHRPQAGGAAQPAPNGTSQQPPMRLADRMTQRFREAGMPPGTPLTER